MARIDRHRVQGLKQAVQFDSEAVAVAEAHRQRIAHENAMLSAQQRNTNYTMAMMPIGSPANRPRNVRATSGLSGTDRRGEGREGV